MSVSSETTPRISYNGNGTTTTFAVPFVFIDSEDLVVYLTNTGVDTLQILDTDYTVTGGDYATGYIIFTSAPTSDDTITIYRETPKTQLTELVPYGALDATSIENGFNKLTLITQELEDATDRVVRVNETSTLTDLTFPDPSASQLIAWNATGTALENVSMSDATLNINSLSTATIDINGDYIPFYDTSAATNKKTLPANIPVNISGLTEDTTPDAAADYIITYDASAGSNKKVKLENFPVDAIVAAPIDASYVTLGTTGNLTSERVLTAGSGISFTDAGAGSTLTAALNINSLTTENTLSASNDTIAFYDASTTANRKTSISNLLTYLDISGATETTTFDNTADYMYIYDASAGANRKILGKYASGDYQLISTTTVSGTPSTIDLTLDTTTYKSFRLILQGVERTGVAGLLTVRFSNDGGSSFRSGASDYGYSYEQSGAASTTDTTESSIFLHSSLSTYQIYTGFIDIIGAASSAVYTTIIGRLMVMTSAGALVITNSSIGYVATKEVNNAIRILPTAGTFTTADITGTIYLYGLK